jgi:hypothetical protein
MNYLDVKTNLSDVKIVVCGTQVFFAEGNRGVTIMTTSLLRNIRITKYLKDEGFLS